MDFDGLVVSVAAKVSTSLNLETRNQTLAKNIITEARGKDFPGFKEGSVSSPLITVKPSL